MQKIKLLTRNYKVIHALLKKNKYMYTICNAGLTNILYITTEKFRYKSFCKHLRFKIYIFQIKTLTFNIL